MNNEPIVLCEEALLDLHGGAGYTSPLNSKMASDMASDIAAAVAMLGSEIQNMLSQFNNALGSPGPYNPYSNPINCEYGGFY